MTTRHSVLRGAFLLSAAGIICKILGAAYRIPLVRLIGDEGIGLYQMAYPVYLVFMALSTAGMPLAISKLVAERAALSDYRGARRVLRLALCTLGGLGAAGGAAMAGGARFFSQHVAADPRAFPVVLSLAPSVPLMALMSALRGFFQGGRDMMPSALSQLVEQIVRVSTLLVLAVLLLPMGIEMAAAGAAFGACAGGAAGLSLLVFWYFSRPWPAGTTEPPPSYWRLARRLVRLALPIAAGALLLPLMQTIDSVMVPTRLQAIGYGVGEATAALGRLGNAWAVIYVPTTITAALAVSLVPAVTEAWTRRQTAAAAGHIRQSLRTTVLICLPATAGLFVLAPEICRVLYGGGSAAGVLRMLAPAAFFLGWQGVCAGALQGIGRTAAPVRNFLLGFILKVAVTGVLCANPNFGLRGAALGTVLGSALAAGLSFHELAKRFPLSGGVYGTLAKSGLGALAMGWLLMVMGIRCLPASLNAFERLLILLPGGMIAYVAVLWLLGGVAREDVEVLRRLIHPGSKHA
ncbi:MAG: putative polysaccharide biosynthesis protein [Bacteroidota bacterium]